MHAIYRNAGCPGTRKISSTAAEVDFVRDAISHQAAANILNGKSFPAWLRLEAMAAALLTLGRSESIKAELERFRPLWVAAHYSEEGSEPPIVGILDDALNRPWPGHQPGSSPKAPNPAPLVGPEPETASTVQTQPQEDSANESTAGPDAAEDKGPTAQGVRVILESTAWSGPEMFSVKSVAGKLIVSLNTTHPMGKSIAKAMGRDEETSRVLSLLLLSWARMEDEIPFMKQRSRVEDTRRDWSRYAGMFMETANQAERSEDP
ncbi:hypothetical protein [Streptomyces sp. NPDC019890]|uniref:hypothetical protein n=1 Tax=Streptomyces sp. NPDC019890 TaxID=3365064 RepID=UPI00384A9D27